MVLLMIIFVCTHKPTALSNIMSGKNMVYQKTITPLNNTLGMVQGRVQQMWPSDTLLFQIPLSMHTTQKSNHGLLRTLP